MAWSDSWKVGVGRRFDGKFRRFAALGGSFVFLGLGWREVERREVERREGSTNGFLVPSEFNLNG